MSVYTTQLRFPIEQALDDMGLAHVESNWPAVYAKLGLSEYPIFDEAHRQVLNDKIIRRYYMREIGLETFGLFRWYVNMTMQEIMPYYNQLYESELVKFDPLATRNMGYSEKWSEQHDTVTDRTETGSRTDTESTEGRTVLDQTVSSDTSNQDKSIYSDTPMSMLQNAAPDPIEMARYATSTTLDKGSTSELTTTDSTTDSTGTRNGKTDDTSKLDQTVDDDSSGLRERWEKGYDRPAAEMLLKYRETFMNIDRMVVDELESLFMGIA